MKFVDFYFQAKFWPKPPAPSPVEFSERTVMQPIDTSILYDTVNAWLANIFKSNQILPLQHFSEV